MMGTKLWWWGVAIAALASTAISGEAAEEESSVPPPAAAAARSPDSSDTERPTVDGPVRQTPAPAYAGEVSEATGSVPRPLPAEDSLLERAPTSPNGRDASAAPTADGDKRNTGGQADLPSQQQATPPETTEQVRRELSPGMAQLRDRLRRLLASYRQNALNIENNDVADVLGVVRAFGCRGEVIRGGNRINAVTCLCWNFPCGGFEPLVMAEGRIAARIGYGRQMYPGQMLGVFALARVPANYPMRVGESVRNVADLVEYEKRACRVEQEQSMRLLGLSFYTNDAPWKNDLGEEWSVERMVAIELSRPVVESPEGGTMRLMALSAAVLDRARRSQPIDGHYARALKFTADFQRFALDLQNSDGSWSPNYFASRGSSRDAAAQLASSGRIMEWLCFSLPDESLADPRLIRGTEYLMGLLGSSTYHSSNIRSLTGRDLASLMHALHALTLFDERMFGPAEAAAAPAAPARTR